MRRTELGRRNASGIGQRRGLSCRRPAQSMIAPAIRRRTSCSSPRSRESCMPARGQLPIGQRPGIEVLVMVAGIRRHGRSNYFIFECGGSVIIVAARKLCLVARATSRQAALGFHRPATLGKKYALQIGRISQNARPFHGLGSLRPRRHAARLIESRHRLGFQIELGSRVLPVFGHRSRSYVGGSGLSVRCSTLEPAGEEKRASLRFDQVFSENRLPPFFRVIRRLARQLFQLRERHIDRAGADVAGVLDHTVEPAIDVENGAFA